MPLSRSSRYVSCARSRPSLKMKEPVYILTVLTSFLIQRNSALKCYTCNPSATCSQESLAERLLVDNADAAYCVKYKKTVLRGGQEVDLIYRSFVMDDTVPSTAGNLNGKCLSDGPGIDRTGSSVRLLACYCQMDGCNAGTVAIIAKGGTLVVRPDIVTVSILLFLALLCSAR